MKAETEALLQECRMALLRQSDERIAALLAQWFENMIGEEYLDEERDDLCLLLNYHVQSWGAQVSYATYTSWWEVEGYLEPSSGNFTCADRASLRQRLLDLPIKQFDILIEMAYQTRAALAELMGGSRLPTGWEGLREMSVWLERADPTSLDVELKMLPPTYARFESKTQRLRREEARAAQASEQGYLVIAPDSSHVVADTYRNWCKKQKQPYILIEPGGQHLALLRIQTRTADIREINAVLTRFQEQLPALAAPSIARAQAQGNDATLVWISRWQVTLARILAADAQAVAQEIIALWSGIVAEERQREIEREALRQAARVPMWKRALTRLSEQDTQPELPSLAEEVVLPAEWEKLLTREHLSAFLAHLSLPSTTRDSKAILVQRILERLATEQSARALFFEIFKLELAVPPWELETLLPCTPTERKRWTDEERLPILELRSFHKAGSDKTYPVFDRRIILTLSHTELERWRAEHQAHLKERRSAAAAARRKDSSDV
jgi:hypothetical protein